MLQVARLAPSVLGDATELVRDFLLAQQNPDGGFRDRAGRSDLYYTVFGIEGIQALRHEMPRDSLCGFLNRHGDGEGLDFVHLCCLLRCRAACGDAQTASSREVLRRIETFRTQDGGYNQRAAAPRCTAYACLLGWSAYADAGLVPPDPEKIATALHSLQTPDGAFANEPGLPLGTTPATAAGAALLRHLGRPVPESLPLWLLAQAHPDGGFKAFPGAPMPDLLSTAVALHALDAQLVSRASLKEKCLDFVDSLWDATGGFHGNWAEDFLDAEYTYYGLLALGHLSLE